MNCAMHTLRMMASKLYTLFRLQYTCTSNATFRGRSAYTCVCNCCQEEQCSIIRVSLLMACMNGIGNKTL